MSKVTILRRKRFVAQRAMRGYDELPAADKIELLMGLADMLPKKSREGQAARQSAWILKASEQQQLKFKDLLGDGAPPPSAG